MTDVARRMMPEPDCWMPLVVVPGTLWRFGESAACRHRGWPLHRSRCVGCASFGFGYRCCAGEQLIVQVIAGFPDRRERGPTFGRLAREAGDGQLQAAPARSQWKSTELPGLGALPEEAGIMTMPRAEDWRSRGGYFSWRPAAEDAEPVEIFHVELGDPGAAVLLLVHGWPTSSIDWFDVAGQLSARFRVCALDFPGYGFSGKPQGWGYSLTRDEELIEFYLAEVLGADAAVMVAHDRGDSVALVHAARCADGRSATRLEHLILSNGNIFLPLSNLTQAQRRILAADSGPQVAAALPAPVLAEAMGPPPSPRPAGPAIPGSRP